MMQQKKRATISIGFIGSVLGCEVEDCHSEYHDDRDGQDGAVCKLDESGVEFDEHSVPFQEA